MRTFFLILLSFLSANVEMFVHHVSFEDGYIEVRVQNDEPIIGFQFQIEASPELNAVFSVDNLVIFEQNLTGYDLDGEAYNSCCLENNSCCLESAAVDHNFSLFGNSNGLIIGFGLDGTIVNPIPSTPTDSTIVLVRIPWTFDIDQSGTLRIGENAKFIQPAVLNSGLPPQYIHTTFTQEYPLDFDRVSIPSEFVLNRAYPNPFNPITSISYELPFGTDVMLTIYDISGRQVRTLERGFKSAGYYSVVWDARDMNRHQVSTGLYIYQLIAGNQILSQKVSLVK